MLNNIFLYLVSVIISFFVVWYLYYRYCFTYWKRRGFPYINPTFPAGNIQSAVLGKKSVYVVLQELYNEAKTKGLRGAGIFFFNGPLLLPVDREIIKSILISDFDHFVDRGLFIDEKNFPLTAHILSMPGERWRNSRIKFSPTFTSGKMKMMYHILQNKCQNLVHILEKYAQNEEIVDIQVFVVKMTVDIIGSCALGIDSNCLQDSNTEYFRTVDRIFNQPKWKLIEFFLVEGFQNPGNIIKIAESDRIVEKFFHDLLKDTVEYRKKNNVLRNDFLSILIEMLDSKQINFQELVAQAFLFFTGGYETSSTTMSFCIHELSHNQQIQDELRKEIHDNLGTDSSKFTYEEILSLPILDSVLKETLRKYPVLAMLNRVCTKEWTIPGTDFTLKKDNLIVISVLGLHRDPEYFPNPMKFDPSRFRDGKPIVPHSYFPFGDGPRNCIGKRFGLMQIKLGIASLLCHYKFMPVPGTPKEIDIDPAPTTLVLGPLEKIRAIVTKI